MSQIAMIKARIEESLKQTVERILDRLEITPDQAITLLYRRIARENGWPLELGIAQDELAKISEEKMEHSMDILKKGSLDELFKQSGI